MAISKRKTGYTVTVSVPNPAGKGRGTRYVVGTYRLRKDAERAKRRDTSGVASPGKFVPCVV